MCACMLSHFSCVQLFANLWTIAHEAPLSKGFSEQEYRNVLLCSPPGLLDPGIELMFLTFQHWQAVSLPLAPLLCTKLLQWCPTLCDPLECSLSDSTVHGLLQARILEWVATPLSRDLPDPGMEPTNLMSPVLIGEFFTTRATCVCSSIFS